MFPFAVAPEAVNTPLSTSEGGPGSVENVNYPVSRPVPGSSETVSPTMTAATDRRLHPHVPRPTVAGVSEPPPLRPPSPEYATDSPQQPLPLGRIEGRPMSSSPVRSSPPLHPHPLPVRPPVIGPAVIGAEQHAYSQHHSMLLSSLMGNRYGH